MPVVAFKFKYLYVKFDWCIIMVFKGVAIPNGIKTINLSFRE